MSVRRNTALAAVAAAGLIALTGCGLGGITKQAQPTPTPAASAAPQPTPNGSAGKASARATTGDLPDVCTLLSRAEVSSLAGGRQITQMDQDGAAADAATRYCQWQFSDARLAVFLSRTTAAEFAQAHGRSTPVSGIGDKAYNESGHLFVLHIDIQIDVYASVSGDTAASARMAKSTAAKIISKL